MARSATETLLPLDIWTKVLGINPWWFNQIGLGFPEDSTVHSCGYVFFQMAWQQDYLSRDEIADAIARAEDMIAETVGYYPAPKYIVNDVAVMTNPRFYPTYDLWHGHTYYGRWNSAQTRYQKVLGGGILARTNIGDAAVTLSDSDGDGVNDTFTATIATTITDVNEIGAYFTSSDRNSEPLDETWRIRPVRVTIAGGIATITGHSSLIIKPDLTLITDPDVLDVTTAANYVTQINIQRVYRDNTTEFSAGTIYWEGYPGDCTELPCDLTAVSACIGDRIGNMGRVYIAYDLATECCYGWRAPDKVNLNYLAGVPLQNGQMNPEWARIVAYLATALLPREKCGCDRSDQIIAHWRTDLIDQGKDSPFGSQRGAIYAWERLQSKIQLPAVVI